MQKKKFTGIFPALVTPFDRQGNLDIKPIQKLIDRNIEKGVNGFYVGGSTGESYLLDTGERKTYLEAVMKVVDGRADVIANIGVFSTVGAIELAKHAESLGVAAISSVPPFYFSFSMDEYIAYYNEIADAVSVPVIIYNIPAMSKVSFSGNDLEKLFANEKIIGMKHTSYDLFQLQKMVEKYPEKIMFCGHDELFLSMSVLGVHAAIGSTFNFMAEKFIHIQKFLNDNRYSEALELQGQINSVVEVLSRIGVFKGVKAALQMQGIDCGVCRRPFLPLKEEEKKQLEYVLKENDIL